MRPLVLVALLAAGGCGRLPGKPAPGPEVPRPDAVIDPVALVAEGMAAITGREPFATLDGLYMARDRMFFTSTKAERELSYHFRPYIQGIEDAVHWFRAAGHLNFS